MLYLEGAAHTLHTDIIVEWFYLLWLFTTNKGAHGGNFRNVYDFADSCKLNEYTLSPRNIEKSTASRRDGH